MTTNDCATKTAMPASQGEDLIIEVPQPSAVGVSKPLRSLLVGFGITVAVGLTLASWYVGVRIVSAEERSTPPAPLLVIAPIPASEDSMAEAYWYTVPPAHFFLQVDGTGTQHDADLVKSLQAMGFSAQVQDAKSESKYGHVRLLIGPFSTHIELRQAQRKLESTGVVAVENTP
jgi:hypothetical protein